MMPQLDGFDWDAGNRQKCAKHGVSWDEIEGLFQGSVAVFPDPAHSMAEARYLAIGKTPLDRYVFIAFTIRTKLGGLYLRPISARYMHAKEIAHYEKALATLVQ